MNCRNCGAPPKRGKAECEYCGTGDSFPVKPASVGDPNRQAIQLSQAEMAGLNSPVLLASMAAAAMMLFQK